MPHHVVEPEVAGGLGERIVVDRSTDPVRVLRLHYQFEGWSGDDLLATHPVFICTDRLGRALGAAGLSGFRLADLAVTTSATFKELYPRRKLPTFRWLQVDGVAEHDDLALRSSRLVVSDRALCCLRSFSLAQATVTPVAEFQWDPEKHSEDIWAAARATAERLRAERAKKTKR